MSIGFRRSHVEPRTERTDGAQRAFTLIEIARLRCDALRSTQADGSALDDIHRELGLAGYYCSDGILAADRHRCLISAYAAVMAAGDEVQGSVHAALKTMFAAAMVACDAVVDALVEHPTDHMHIAHLHALSAAASLDDLLNGLIR